MLSTNLLLLGLLASSTAYSAPSCQSLFDTPSVAGTQTDRIYAKGIDKNKTPDGHFQISYESEYLFSESGVLLRDYAPAEDIISRSKWQALTDEQRIDWVKSKFGDKPEYATAAGLKRIIEVDFLPEELIVDSTGNLEIVINPPLDSYKQWEKVVDYIVNKYGAGSQQAMISKPREAAFSPSRFNLDMEHQHLGWLNFTNLYDMFEKLDNGYTRYLKDPTKLTAQFFDHPFLGPMTKIKRDTLEQYLLGNNKLEFYDDDSKQYVRKSDASFKYTGGPAYRPDIAGPIRWAWEIRNAHKDTAGLKAKVLRDLEAHKQGLEDYKIFSTVPAFDALKEFERLPLYVRNSLVEIFPSKADPRFQYGAKEKLSLETYRNFAMPLMDMDILVAALSDTYDTKELNRNLYSVRKARLDYIHDVNVVSEEYRSKRITKDMAKAKIMGLIGKWAVNSRLFELFKKVANRLGHDQRNIENINTLRKID